MLAILTHRFPLFQKKEIWFYNGEPVNEVAYNSYCYAAGNFTLTYDYQLKEYTAIIDLRRSEAELFNSINTTFKYHIRKAEKLKFDYFLNANPSLEDCSELIRSFKEFALKKNILQMNSRRIFALQRSNHLIITKIKEGSSDVSTHVYLFDQTRIVLLHTFHNLNYLKNRERGYANKYQHWKDLLLFKEMKFTSYDFGGIDTERVPGITNFKLGFGGEIMNVYSYVRIKPFFKFFFRLYKRLR
jgi:hypothetical protein